MALITRTNGSAGSNIITASWFNDFNNLFKGVMVDQPVTFGNTLTITGVSTLNGGVNTNTIRDGTNGNPALDLSLGTGAIKLPLALLINDAAAVTVNGSTTGTATLYQPLRGTIKLVFIVLSNFRNGVAGDQLLAIPAPFVTTMMGWSGQTGAFDLKHSAGNISIGSQLTWPGAAGGFGTVGTTTNTQSQNFFTGSACDTVGLFGSSASTFTGSILMIGI